MRHPAVAAHLHPCQFLGRSCSGWLTQTGLRGALECLVHAAAKTASGPTPNSFAFNSNLIRPLNGFSAQPFSAFHSYSPSLPPPPSSIFLITLFHSVSFFPLCPYRSLAATMRRHWPTSLLLSSSASLLLHLARFVFLSHSLFRVPVLCTSCFQPVFFLSHHGHQLWFVRDLQVAVQTPDSHYFLHSPH